MPLSTGHLPDRPPIDGYSKGCENLRARRAGFNPPITPSRRSPSCIARFQLSSATFFDPVLNPGYRLDEAFGLSLGAIEQGRIDMLRQCFDDLFSRPAQAREWWNSFRKCKTWDEAEDHLLCVYGIKRASKAQLPKVFRQGMSALLRSLLSDNLQQLKAESQTIQVRIQQLKTLLETPETDGRPADQQP